jgi:hypothetical protein
MPVEKFPSHDQVEYLIEIGAVKKLEFGDQIHYERRVTSQLAFEALEIKSKKVYQILYKV